MRNRLGARTGLVCATLVSCLLHLPGPIRAEDAPREASERGVFKTDQISSGVAVVVALLVVRPLGAVATVVGLGLFVPAALLSLSDYPDGLQEAWELFVTIPAKNVYERPLGDL